MRFVTPKLSRLRGCGGPCLPALMSQHVPVQFDATGLHAEKGASTTISIWAVTRALCSVTWMSESTTRLTRRKLSQALALDPRDAKIDRVHIRPRRGELTQ